MAAIYSLEINENIEPFDCAICMDTIEPRQGVILKECLHLFCKYTKKTTFNFYIQFLLLRY
jgi:hypothetical protein